MIASNRLLLMLTTMVVSITASAQQITTHFMQVDEEEMVESVNVFTLNPAEKTITIENEKTHDVKVLRIININEPISRNDMEVVKMECKEDLTNIDFFQTRSTLPNKPMMFTLVYKLGQVEAYRVTYMTDW